MVTSFSWRNKFCHCRALILARLFYSLFMLFILAIFCSIQWREGGEFRQFSLLSSRIPQWHCLGLPPDRVGSFLNSLSNDCDARLLFYDCYVSLLFSLSRSLRSLVPGASSKLMGMTTINLRNVPPISAPFQSFDSVHTFHRHDRQDRFISVRERIFLGSLVKAFPESII